MFRIYAVWRESGQKFSSNMRWFHWKSLEQIVSADIPRHMTLNLCCWPLIRRPPCLSSGMLRVSLADMDRETRENYSVVIQAKDMGGQLGGLAGTTTVNITLGDINDNPPVFDQSKRPTVPLLMPPPLRFIVCFTCPPWSTRSHITVL